MTFSIQEDWSISFKQIKESEIKTEGGPQQPNMDALTTFRLSLRENELQQKENLTLPYLK